MTHRSKRRKKVCRLGSTTLVPRDRSEAIRRRHAEVVSERAWVDPLERYGVLGAAQQSEMMGGLGEDGGSFVFELRGPRKFFTDGELLDQLRGFGRVRGGRAFTHKQFCAWKERRCSANTIRKRFGSWAKALAMAGIRGARVGSYGPRELMEHLEKVWRIMGRPPGVRTLRRHGPISAGPYMSHWGSLRRACARLAKFKRGEITAADLLRPVAVQRRRTLAPGVRWRVFERDGQRCCVCGRGAADRGVRLEVDHIVPVSAGGTDEISNLRTLCGMCNRGRGDRVAGLGVGRKRKELGRRAA